MLCCWADFCLRSSYVTLHDKVYTNMYCFIHRPLHFWRYLSSKSNSVDKCALLQTLLIHSSTMLQIYEYHSYLNFMYVLLICIILFGQVLAKGFLMIWFCPGLNWPHRTYFRFSICAQVKLKNHEFLYQVYHLDYAI